MSEKIR